jgi:hypothetical protein
MATIFLVAEPVVSRSEVEALLFAVHDINQALWDIHGVLLEEDDDGEETDEG